MKIIFENSKLQEGTIRISLDGGFTFADYEIADVKSSGVPLSNSQELDKIKVKGPANVLKNLDIVSSVKVEGASNTNTEPKQEYYNPKNYHAYKSDEGYLAYIRAFDFYDDTYKFDGIVYAKSLDGTQFIDPNSLENKFNFIGWKGYDYQYKEDNDVIIAFEPRANGTSHTYYRYEEGDDGLPLIKEKPVYAYNTDLHVDYVTTANEANPPATVTNGDTYTTIILNYDYLADLFSVDDGRPIYFYAIPPYKNDSDEPFTERTYFTEIHPGELRSISLYWNFLRQEGNLINFRYCSKRPIAGKGYDDIRNVYAESGEPVFKR